VSLECGLPPEARLLEHTRGGVVRDVTGGEDTSQAKLLETGADHGSRGFRRVAQGPRVARENKPKVRFGGSRILEREVAGADHAIFCRQNDGEFPDQPRRVPLACEHAVEIRARLRGRAWVVEHEPGDVRVRRVRVDRVEVVRREVPECQTSRVQGKTEGHKRC